MARKRCVTAIMDLMADYKPRTSEQIADEIGYDLGKVRALLRTELMYEKTRKRVAGGGAVVYHSLKRHCVPALPTKEGQGSK